MLLCSLLFGVFCVYSQQVSCFYIVRLSFFVPVVSYYYFSQYFSVLLAIIMGFEAKSYIDASSLSVQV